MANDEHEHVDVAAIRAAIDRAAARWEAGATTLTALPAEARRARLGAVPPAGEPSLVAREQAGAQRPLARAMAQVPVSVDLRTQGYITPVGDQGQCGSCVAFGSLATIEGTARVTAKQSGLAIDLSEAHLFYCHAAAQGRHCSTGWWVDPALDACRDLGVVDEAVFPYVAGDQACQVGADSTAPRFKITGYKKWQDVAEMKDWLATKGALAACFSVYQDFYAYTGGVYRHASGGLEGGHCVSIVGYDDASGCWIAKNSWGTGWGENGFFKIAYGECGIDFEMWGVEVPPPHQDDTWLERQTITGLWMNADDGGAAAYVKDAGWKRLPDEPAAAPLLVLLASAKATNAPTDVRLVDDVIREVYVL